MESDLELEVGGGQEPGSYEVRVVHSAAGGEPVGMLRLDVDELLGRRPALEATLLASSVGGRRRAPMAEQPVQQIGRQLFEAVFAGPVLGTYRASLGVAEARHKRLRVVLRLTAPELAALPWEALFDPETETYLCRQEPLVRHVPAPFTPDPLQVRPPLRVLGLVAAPRGLPGLDVVNCPGFGRDSLVGSGDQTGQVAQLVQSLELDRWPASAGSVKSPVVVPVHPYRGGHVDFLHIVPRPESLYQLGLVQAYR